MGVWRRGVVNFFASTKTVPRRGPLGGGGRTKLTGGASPPNKTGLVGKVVVARLRALLNTPARRDSSDGQLFCARHSGHIVYCFIIGYWFFYFLFLFLALICWI